MHLSCNTLLIIFCWGRAAIAKLRDDNAKLKEELLLENKFSVTPTSSNLSANIANLQDQSDVYTRKVRSHAHQFLHVRAKVLVYLISS